MTIYGSIFLGPFGNLKMAPICTAAYFIGAMIRKKVESRTRGGVSWSKSFKMKKIKKEEGRYKKYFL